MSVRVRFAPSPTGYLHVGGVRTALYNWLFARHHGGTAVLRIEDTDTEREAAGAIEQIQRSLDWLGLDFDESPRAGGPHGPYLQSERAESYRAAVERLLEEGHAYRCFQTPEELEAARARARHTDDPAAPTRLHRDLTREQVSRFEADGRPAIIRFRTPLEGETVIEDLVRGRVAFEHRLLGDTVLLRGDGAPTYQLANPLDDMAMGITHVIRGEDLLPSTPRQRLLVEALGGTFPATAHLSMILGPDRKRLSKRHGAASVEEFRELGYLPEALVNYLALLGWSWDGETELMSIPELVERFSLDRVNPAPAVFDHQKLAWMNGAHLRELDAGRYAEALADHLRDVGSPLAEDERLAEAVPLVREKLGALGEFDALAGSLLDDRPAEPEALRRLADDERAGAILDDADARLAALEPFDAAAVEEALKALCEGRELKPRQAFAPIRIAVSGATVAPGLYESIAFLGRDEALRRIRRARAGV
jgi:glutamyl-tRNA synthetase